MVRKGQGDYDSDNECIQKKKAREEINKYQIPDSIHVTRFVSIQEWIVWFFWTIGKKEYIHRGFVSTTLIKDLFSSEEIKRGKVIIGINIPKGTKGILVPEISERNPEYEILLPYYTKFKRVSWNEYKVADYIDKLKWIFIFKCFFDNMVSI